MGSISNNQLPQISVAWYGAVGDGVADDTAAIQAAINAGYSVTDSTIGPVSTMPIFFPSPPAFYKITAPLRLNKSFSALIGARQGVMIRNIAGGDVVQVNQGSTATLTGVKIESLTLIGTSATSRAIYANQIEHLRIEQVNCIGHSGTALYMESTGSALSGCAFAKINQLLVQPSASVVGIIDIGGINNQFSNCRIRECETGILLQNAFGTSVDSCYIESNNRGTAKTGVRALSSSIGTLLGKRNIRISNTYFENNTSFSVDADASYFTQMENCSTTGGADLAAKTALQVVRLGGGGEVRFHRGGGGTFLTAPNGKIVVCHSSNIYGLVSEVQIEGSVSPFIGPAENLATKSYYPSDVVCTLSGTNPPTQSLSTSQGYLGANSKQFVFPTGGNGAAFSRAFITNANLTVSANDVYTSMLALKASAANEILLVRHGSTSNDGSIIPVITSTGWIVVVLSSGIAGSGTANTNIHLGANVVAPLTVNIGAIATTLKGNRIALLSTP